MVDIEGRFSRRVVEKAKKKKIISLMKEWDGEEGIYIVSGSYGSNVQIVRVEISGGELGVYCSCTGFLRGLCSHVYLVFKHILEKDGSVREAMERWLEKREEEVKKKNGSD